MGITDIIDNSPETSDVAISLHDSARVLYDGTTNWVGDRVKEVGDTLTKEGIVNVVKEIPNVAFEAGRSVVSPATGAYIKVVEDVKSTLPDASEVEDYIPGPEMVEGYRQAVLGDWTNTGFRLPDLKDSNFLSVVFGPKYELWEIV